LSGLKNKQMESCFAGRPGDRNRQGSFFTFRNETLNLQRKQTDMNRKKTWAMGQRIGLYLLGVAVLAFGITLNTKTNLGVSPIISVAYCAADISGISLGTTTFLWYMLMIAAQLLLLGKDFKPWQFLQVGASFLTSWFIGIFETVLPAAENMVMRFVLLGGAIVITSLGILLTVGMEIVPNPADGFAHTLARKMGQDLGFGKNLFDFACILISVTVGLAAGGRLIGIGVGTVCTMFLTGRVVAVMNRLAGNKVRAVVERSRSR